MGQVREAKAAWDGELAQWNQEKDPWSLEVAKDSKYMHPRQMLRELEKAMPDDAMVSTDIGNICQVANSYLQVREAAQHVRRDEVRQLRLRLPHHDRLQGGRAATGRAVAYVGDGAWGMSFSEILTCVREKIPVTAVVFNNRQWGAEKKNHVDFYNNRFLGGEPGEPELRRHRARHGRRGRHRRPARRRRARRCATRARRSRTGKTTILEMMCTRELGDPFRRDALKKPVRLLEKYKAYV